MMKNISQKFLSVFVGVTLIASFAVPASAATNPYENADLLLSSVLNHLQYPIPKTITETPDHHLNFSEAKPDFNHPWKDEVRYVAAYSFCQRLVPQFPVPPHGTSSTLTTSDIMALTDSANNIAMRSAAMEECLAAVAYRTACPKNNTNLTKVGAGISCYETQKRMCHYMKDPPGQGGLGIDQITVDGSDDADGALRDCDDQGLSPAMYDKILAHRCDSTKYVQNLPMILGAKSAAVEHTIQFECQQAKDAFEAKMDREREGILIAIQTLLQMRGLGMEVDKGAQPVGH